MGEHEEQFVFEMGYNKGFKDGIKGLILKSDYEARLKADMMAILVELQLGIEEIEVAKENIEIRAGECCMKGACINLIQEKINALKGEQDGSN